MKKTHNNCNKLIVQVLSMFLLLLFISVDAAPGNGTGNTKYNVFTVIAQTLQSYIKSIVLMSRSIGGVVGFIGALKVYILWTLGDRNLTKIIIAWGAAMLFLHLLPTFLALLF